MLTSPFWSAQFSLNCYNDDLTVDTLASKPPGITLFLQTVAVLVSKTSLLNFPSRTLPETSKFAVFKVIVETCFIDKSQGSSKRQGLPLFSDFKSKG